MCGIVGFTAPGQDPAAAKQIVQGMADLIRHRGPDGEGCYADGTAALGHRRLSVIDLAGGGQPMLNEDGTLDITLSKEAPEDPSNWLPVSDGEFHLFMRIYLPDMNALDAWQPPVIHIQE